MKVSFKHTLLVQSKEFRVVFKTHRTAVLSHIRAGSRATEFIKSKPCNSPWSKILGGGGGELKLKNKGLEKD